MERVRLQEPVEGADYLVRTQVPATRNAKRNRSSGPLVGQGDAKFGGGLRSVAGRASEVENLLSVSGLERLVGDSKSSR
jgi:hypothetical protein